MSTSKGIWFVYRSRDAGPLSKRVCRIEAPSILAWFQEKLADARSALAPQEVADADLGGSVLGFGRLLAAAKEHKLAAPKSTAALQAMLAKHLVLQGRTENLRLDEHTLRVLMADQATTLAYCFFDDDAMREHPERVAWLLEEDPRLLDGEEEGDFDSPVPLRVLGPVGVGEGATYVCLPASFSGSASGGVAAVLPGVRLPGLAVHLCDAEVEPLDLWPIEVRLLRAMLSPMDRTLAPALERLVAYPLRAVEQRDDFSRLGVGSQVEARQSLLKAAEGLAHEGDPSQSIVHEGEHIAVLCVHVSRACGYQQWIFFDDRWAAAYPDLAASMLRYAREWDPFPWPPVLPGVVKDVATPLAGTWDDAMKERGAGDARAYRPGERFAVGDLLTHAKFGVGVVRRVEATKIEVVFHDSTRVLTHGVG